MKVRYKKTGTISYSHRFNVYGIGEILTGDDSAIINEMEVEIHDKDKNPFWKDMRLAFEDKDLIPDNYNVYFREPISE